VQQCLLKNSHGARASGFAGDVGIALASGHHRYNRQVACIRRSDNLWSGQTGHALFDSRTGGLVNPGPNQDLCAAPALKTVESVSLTSLLSSTIVTTPDLSHFIY
jgi:hypothetical protein